MPNKIHEFLLNYFALVFGIVCYRASKILSSLVGVDRGQRGIRVLRLRYFVCYLRVSLWKYPNIK